MKLIFCPDCQDVRKIGMQYTQCECELSWAQYEPDGLNAIIGGKAIPIGFANSTLRDALTFRPETGMGSIFTAFVIPKCCPTIEVEE